MILRVAVSLALLASPLNVVRADVSYFPREIFNDCVLAGVSRLIEERPFGGLKADVVAALAMAGCSENREELRGIVEAQPAMDNIMIGTNFSYAEASMIRNDKFLFEEARERAELLLRQTSE